MANLCLLRVSLRIFSDSALLPRYSAHYYEAILGNIVLLTFVWWSLLRLGRRGHQRGYLKVFQATPLLALAITANNMRDLVPGPIHVGLFILYLGAKGFVAFCFLLGISVLYLVWTRFRSCLALTEFFFLIASLCIVITVGACVWHLKSRPAMLANASANQMIERVDVPNRVVWLLFDGLDQRLSFDDRPGGITLPELARLRSSAIYATNAIPPSTETRLSIPSLLTGRFVSATDLEEDPFRITFQDCGTASPMDQEETLFSKARQRGIATAVAGWYLPYCRTFGKDLTECAWEPFYGSSIEENGTVDQLIPLQLRTILPSERHRKHLEAYWAILEKARRFTVDSRFGLVYVHWPIPHGPGIYDRRKRQFTVVTWQRLEDWYLDNLTLADQTIGEIRRAMEKTGVWDNTTVLITSDHSWTLSKTFDGKEDSRVPFLLKLPGQTTPVTYEARFNTILIHDLLLEILSGRLSSTSEIVPWLDRDRSAARAPCTPGSLLPKPEK